MSTMTWDDYVSVTSLTAVYPDSGEGTALEMAYLALGLIGEAGEVSKALFNSDRDHLLSEIGDCCWYLARIDHSYILPKARNEDVLDELASLLHALEEGAFAIANAAKKCLRDGASFDRTLNHAAHLHATIEQLVKWVGPEEPSLFEHILFLNHEKLMARLKAGTIGGDGDKR